jgi:mannobiose 2-epimerase
MKDELQSGPAVGGFSTEHKAVYDQLEEALVDNVLRTWYPRTLDLRRGGFLTNFDHRWRRRTVQEKHIVTQARGLWTASQAARRFFSDLRYIEAAEHGFKYLLVHMWDHKLGGFFSVVGGERTPGTWSGKHSYGLAFGIYAVSSYYSLTGDPRALDLAKRAFHWLEERAYDHEAGGYFNFIDESRDRTAERHVRPALPCEELPCFKKDCNSMLHIMEALSELYRIWPDVLVAQRLRESLQLMRDIITTRRGHLRLNFDRDWNPITFEYGSEAVNLGQDHVSFGHDIESATLMLRAERSLDSVTSNATLATAKALVDHALQFGFDSDYDGIFCGAFYYPGNTSPTVVFNAKAWWCQAEGLLGLKLFSRLFPDESRYETAFQNLWKYIRNNVIDYRYGDWFCEGLDVSPRARCAPKAHAWKCNYHTSRSLMWCMDLLRGVDILEAGVV